MWGSHLSSDGHENNTTRVAIVLAVWQISDKVIPKMFDTLSRADELLCVVTQANVAYVKSAFSPSALEQA
jgi:hypothetical protein